MLPVGIRWQSFLTMLLAVAHRHGGLKLHGQDVFANVVGGVRLAETAGDLAIAVGRAFLLNNSPVPGSLIVFGELGLAGEIRPVPFGEERLPRGGKTWLSSRRWFPRRISAEADLPKG